MITRDYTDKVVLLHDKVPRRKSRGEEKRFPCTDGDLLGAGVSLARGVAPAGQWRSILSVCIVWLCPAHCTASPHRTTVRHPSFQVLARGDAGKV